MDAFINPGSGNLIIDTRETSVCVGMDESDFLKAETYLSCYNKDFYKNGNLKYCYMLDPKSSLPNFSISFYFNTKQKLDLINLRFTLDFSKSLNSLQPNKIKNREPSRKADLYTHLSQFPLLLNAIFEKKDLAFSWGRIIACFDERNWQIDIRIIPFKF